MVTRFVASLRTDNSPQRKEARPLSHADIRFIQHLDSSAHGLVRRWLLIGYFFIEWIPPSQFNTTPVSLSLSHTHMGAHRALNFAVVESVRLCDIIRRLEILIA